MIRRFFRVEGIVQGVGFRPFVSRLASDLGLTGWVLNTTGGVEIEVQGATEDVESFGCGLESSPPPMAMLLSLTSEAVEPIPGESGFAIRASRSDAASSVVIPPDIATCGKCLAELENPGDRRYGYPFTNCTDCGPRYTIIETIPYDRERTTMSGFRMCDECDGEYHDQGSRRFHAQPNACPACGPSLTCLSPSGEQLSGDPLENMARVIAGGGVGAIMGLGGFHLAVDATDEGAVSKLRKRKQRPFKPLAIMVKDVASARKFALLPEAAETELESPRAPILLLETLPEAKLAPSVAPGQNQTGIFLPYTPLHRLLFKAGDFEALVMTSGNRSDEPIVSSYAEATASLSGVADAFLVHDRPIEHRVDDSVMKMMGNAPMMLRRARGYAPQPLPLPNASKKKILAVGAELLNTITIVRNDHAFISPHVGDLKNLETEEHFERAISHLTDLLRVEIETVVHDLHPSYRSTAYAERLENKGLPAVAVQHHEAHASACMAENGHSADGVALVLDGTGYGRDGTVWGGEIFTGRPGSFERAAHLATTQLPGGDAAAKEPWRMAASHLRRLRGSGWKDIQLPAFEANAAKLEQLEAMMERGLNSPLTSSCGRLFDCAAALCGFTGKSFYSAQAPMELEALASRHRGAQPKLPAAGGLSGDLIDPSRLLEWLLEGALGGRDKVEMAFGFHVGLARLFGEAVSAISEKSGLEDLFLAGGCFQNWIFTKHLVEELGKKGLRVHAHRLIPPNDGSISFGQAAWALGARG